MQKVTKTLAVLVLLLLLAGGFRSTSRGQNTPLAGTSELIQALNRLSVLGSLLHIGAHPDDENTALIAYFARGRHIRTAYLSATRGEGGQNLIGSEQYEALGLIRTQELLAARRIDGGEQFFTRAFDFGFSKSPEEAIAKWGRERVLGDMVAVIRRFRPDVIVARFHPTGSSGHGHHTAAGHLTPVAFAAAADPTQFPEQIAEGLRPWRAKRVVWNVFEFGRRPPGVTRNEKASPAERLWIDAGEYDPVLGRSYAEIAGESRSQHWSQGFGSPERRGPSRHSFEHLAGEPAARDLFDGIDTTWNRVAGGAAVGRLVAQARREFRPEKPEAILPLLIQAYQEMQRLNDPWVELKRRETLHAIQLAAGMWVDAQADRWDAVPGSSVNITLTALNRCSFPLEWQRTEISGVSHATVAANRPLGPNAPEQLRSPVTIPPQAPDSEPFWMRQPRSGDYYPIRELGLIGLPENPPPLEATFCLRAAGGLTLPFRVPVQYRWVERVGGEQVRPLEIVPPVSVSFAQSSIVFPEGRAREIVVRVAASGGAAKGTLRLEVPAGWKVPAASMPFELAGRDQHATFTFDVTPPAAAAGGWAAARADVGGVTVSSGVVTIRHPHIPPQTMFPPARARLERFDVRLAAKNVGYVMGAGDEVPQALEQMGAQVKLLSAEDLASGDLAAYDAIVTGVRAANVRPDLTAARKRLLDYVASGGTLVVQYNTVDGFGFVERSVAGGTAQLAPYPLTPSSNRVSVEEAPVTFPNPDLPLLHGPNKLGARDFDGWIQERGLYFIGKWDQRYQPIFACNDPGEPPQLGGTLIARYGKGVWIYTGYAWFRQLPAGVPGAYRIFANLVSAGRESMR